MTNYEAYRYDTDGHLSISIGITVTITTIITSMITIIIIIYIIIPKPSARAATTSAPRADGASHWPHRRHR